MALGYVSSTKINDHAADSEDQDQPAHTCRLILSKLSAE